MLRILTPPLLVPPEFEPLLSWTFWKVPQEGVSTDPSLVYPSTMSTECYDEQLSDKCLTLLLGTWYESWYCRTFRPRPLRLTCLPLLEQEGERDALHRHQTLPGHHDPLWLSSLLAVPPAALLPDRTDGEKLQVLL